MDTYAPFLVAKDNRPFYVIQGIRVYPGIPFKDYVCVGSSPNVFVKAADNLVNVVANFD